MGHNMFKKISKAMNDRSWVEVIAIIIFINFGWKIKKNLMWFGRVITQVIIITRTGSISLLY